MRKFIAAASALALAACGSADAEVDPAAETASIAEEVIMSDSPLVGTYGGMTEEDEPWTSTINADGSYEDTVSGEVVETGNWTHESDEICFNPTVLEGEPADQTCMSLLNVNDDGSLLLETPDGNEITVPKLITE